MHGNAYFKYLKEQDMKALQWFCSITMEMIVFTWCDSTAIDCPNSTTHPFVSARLILSTARLVKCFDATPNSCHLQARYSSMWTWCNMMYLSNVGCSNIFIYLHNWRVFKQRGLISPSFRIKVHKRNPYYVHAVLICKPRGLRLYLPAITNEPMSASWFNVLM